MPTGPVTLEAAGELLGVTGEAVRKRIEKGQLTGSKDPDGKWLVAVDGPLLELAEAARLRKRPGAAPHPSNPKTVGAPQPPPTSVGAPAEEPAAGTSHARIEAPRVQPKKRPRLEDLGDDPKPGKLETGGHGDARTSKVTAHQVERATVAAFGLIASVRRREWWQVGADEVAPWSAEAAGLVNSLPLPLVTAAASISGATVVMMGLFGILYSRMAMDSLMEQQAQPAARAPSAAAEHFARAAAAAPPPGQVIVTPAPGPQGARAAAPVPAPAHEGIGAMFGGLAA